ncbi:protein translocase subunit SecF [Candidatus Berkelbacteria bacterium CG_4_9_14_3_um_filter_39_23]|uniref:Protein-export membrane protein SecF n=2 Tax=Candidatus Berkelbacteria TaxID=1618330 RepID=A0A2M7CJ44_9BACT|nr:protein translocase subunit SecF [Candidatus Berkelbacteria bacterium]OIP05835.1 MAG: protein-export membrane protein SecF [Candidatus Berkelbacteria bacterium CG2_30_39_44]PIR28257.1 MAG: protein translocase subunit SecF [Candidatus Berkelbacteria bacterium CG11_big_fil_rev_8_21_14_0_20_40_23]PIV25683.1 MAG: protein translocase subunit SecF [Candidatus Berkelbacteria bacterium CG03_land_8_20_14_0_80_40_36]PIX30810.1 MAG: protein translocase subunit SecF [Candidatus Berkelbacteria bacterium 
MNFLGKKKKWYLVISWIVISIGLACLFVFKLKPGIDFAGGSLIEVDINKQTSINEIKDTLIDEDLPNLNIYQIGERGWILKTKEISEEKKNQTIKSLGKVGETIEKRFESVGPTVSNDLRKKSILAISLATTALIFYIAIAFYRLPKFLSPWKFGLAAIVALAHDLLVVLGAFAIFGHFLGYEIDSLFITAMLTILGFSVHDTIVVFDRIRENFRSDSPVSHLKLEEVANYSIVQTIARSLNTSLTIILVLLAMLVLGGQTLQPFILALLVGMITGTYSSIFIATPLLIYWHKGK